VLRVLTLNIWNLSGPWRDRRSEVLAWLDLLSPDVVCLQEVVEAPDGRNQARWLADQAGGWHVAYAGADIGGGARFGNAVLSRSAIDGQAAVDLPCEPKEGEVQRVVLHARTAGLDVFTTHLNWEFPDGAIRERQAQALAAFVDESRSADRLTVVTGDFNAEPDSTEIRYLCGLTSLERRSVHYHDAWRVAGADSPGWTWDNRNPFAAAVHEPDRRIDYVFSGWKVGPVGRVESARVVCDRALTGTFASDHFGVLAEIATASG
jgi:endonuclease/exonuclease/phosphatase family metal-dependent hydrolase